MSTNPRASSRAEWYRTFRDTHGCLPGGINPNVWGTWGGGGTDSADAIPQMIGWDSWFIHGDNASRMGLGFVDGQVHYSDGNGESAFGPAQEYHPVCIREKRG